MLIFFTFSFRPATNKKLIYLLLPLSIGISIIFVYFMQSHCTSQNIGDKLTVEKEYSRWLKTCLAKHIL